MDVSTGAQLGMDSSFQPYATEADVYNEFTGAATIPAIDAGEAAVPGTVLNTDTVDVVSVDEESSSGSSVEEEPEDQFVEQLELQDYKLIAKIGEGAFSKVYRGVPQEHSSKSFLSRAFKQVAVKVISKKHLSSTHKDAKSKATSREQVLKEVAIHRTVSASENVVSFVDFQESHNYYFLSLIHI